MVQSAAQQRMAHLEAKLQAARSKLQEAKQNKHDTAQQSLLLKQRLQTQIPTQVPVQVPIPVPVQVPVQVPVMVPRPPPAYEWDQHMWLALVSSQCHMPPVPYVQQAGKDEVRKDLFEAQGNLQRIMQHHKVLPHFRLLIARSNPLHIRLLCQARSNPSQIAIRPLSQMLFTAL